MTILKSHHNIFNLTHHENPAQEGWTFYGTGWHFYAWLSKKDRVRALKKWVKPCAWEWTPP